MTATSAHDPAADYKYWAFISYSHQDNLATRGDGSGGHIPWANWLHEQLETFRVPDSYRDRPAATGEPMPERFFPAFRDEAELPTSHDLGGQIRDALRRSRFLIVIDALDEAGEAGRNPLVEMLARHAPRLPDWLGLVVTSRLESAVQTPLQGLNPFVLDTRTEANRADLRDYLRQKIAPQLHDRPDADRLLGQILEKNEGVFLYVERFCDDVQLNILVGRSDFQRKPSSFPNPGNPLANL